jgi:hypothetical protein
MDSLKGWILSAVGLSFAAGITAGVAGTTVYGAPSMDPAAAQRGELLRLFDARFGLDAKQLRLLAAILEKRDEEDRDLLDREVLPDLLQDRRDAIGRKTDQRIYKILDPGQRAIYDGARETR